MELKDVNIYRIIHIDNINHVLRYGITHKDSRNANQNFVSIGDMSLINNRDSKLVKVLNGKSTGNFAQTIRLGDFIPFYFGVRMPMLYVIQQGGNFVDKAVNPENIVYIACSVLQVVNLGNKFYFSDGHGIDNYTKFYDNSKLSELVEIIDWEAIKEKFWGTGNLLLKRKKQAEFVIEGDIPPELIIGFGCYNEKAKVKLLNMGVMESKIRVIPNAYY